MLEQDRLDKLSPKEAEKVVRSYLNEKNRQLDQLNDVLRRTKEQKSYDKVQLVMYYDLKRKCEHSIDRLLRLFPQYLV